jgi:hypothetical protein
MSRKAVEKRHICFLTAVMSLLLVYNVLMTSVNVNTPFSTRIHDDKLLDDDPTVNIFSMSQELGEDRKLNQNQIIIPAVEEIDDSLTIQTKTPESVSSEESAKPNETTNELTTTQLPNKETDEETTTSKAIIKVKDYYETGFSYPNPELCHLDGMGVKLLILIISAPGHFSHREAIRLTWGHYTLQRNVAIAFLIGKTNDLNTIDGLNYEMALYDDIIQANFQDSYQNLTLKTMAMLEWTSSYCSKAEFLLKADDDMFINVQNLLQFIDKMDRSEVKIYGRLVTGWEPVRDEESKYFLPYEQFSDNVFPDFVTGPAYLFPTLIAQSFFETGMEARFMQMEDVFMTGLLAEAMNVTRVKVDEFQNGAIDVQNTSPCELSKYISIHMISYPEQFEIWRQVLDGKSEC